jgi:3'-5' exoribonuclease
MEASRSEKGKSHLWIKDIKERDRVQDCYLVKMKNVGTTRKGDPFLTIILADRTGEIEAKVWERAKELSPLFGEGDILSVDGVANSYRSKLQITISNLKKAQEETDPALFLESTPEDPSEMMASLKGILRKIKNTHLKTLSDGFFADNDFIRVFEKSPAAKNFHHSYIGGLLEHTLSVCQMAVSVAEHYPQLDGDLLIIAAFLHDLGKTRELTFQPFIDYTDEGRLLGHLTIGTAILDEKLASMKNFPMDLAIKLKHMILSHHGEFDFGSPKRPKFLEAFALHLIDDLDAKINGLGRFMEKDGQEGAWTVYNRLFERYFLKGEILSKDEKARPGGDPDEKQGTLFSV